MTIIKIQNNYSYLVTNDEKLKKTLWESLRFREKNYFHSSLYKRKVWDGYTDFFKKDNGKFLTGLLPEIELALKYLKVDYKIIKENKDFEFNTKQINADYIDDKNLYDYQVDYVNQVLKHKRGIIHAPTSAGKTLIMIAILKALPNVPTLVLANRKTLVQQNYEKIQEAGFAKIGRVYGKYQEVETITCATVQSLHKIEKLLPHVQVLIVDEIHEMMSKTPKKFYNKMNDASVRIALSATPFTFGGTDKTQKYSVKGYFGPILRTKEGVLTTKKLQERGILSQSKAIFYPINEPQIPFEIYQDAVTKGIAESFHFAQVINGLRKTLQGRSLILVERIAHGDQLANLIPNSLWVQGKDNDETRKYVIDQLTNHNGNIIGIATHKIFNTGINFFIHNLINACGGKADHQIIQRMGRGLRTKEDKELLHYYDFVFNINDYLYEHSIKRIKILENEGHEVILKDEIDFKY